MIQIGKKVYLKFTNEWAEVVLLPDEEPYVLVELSDGDQILVHSEDVYSEEEYAYMEAEGEVESEKESAESATTPFEVPGDGLYLLLESMQKKEIPDEYNIWLVNKTPFLCEFSGHLFNNEGSLFQEDGLMDEGMQHMLCELFSEDLSLQTKCDLNLVFTDGTASESHLIRHRFQAKKILNGNWDIQGVSQLKWFSLMTPGELFKPREELKKPVIQKNLKKPGISVNIHSIERRAAFPLEIDLHAAALIPNHKSLDKKDILQKQMAAFEEYIQEAYRLGMDKIAVIHGLGEGKLRERIHQRLDQLDWVKDFRNEYHPRYGWGATEVFL